MEKDNLPSGKSDQLLIKTLCFLTKRSQKTQAGPPV